MASPPYEIGRFYYSDGGVMYQTDAALQRTGTPVAELGLEHDVVNAALDRAEDAVVAMARGLARLITHPLQTIADLAKLPGAVAQLIANSPEYWERFKAMPLPDQVRAASELVSTLLLMYGTAAGTGSLIGSAGKLATSRSTSCACRLTGPSRWRRSASRPVRRDGDARWPGSDLRAVHGEQRGIGR